MGNCAILQCIFKIKYAQFHGKFMEFEKFVEISRVPPTLISRC